MNLKTENQTLLSLVRRGRKARGRCLEGKQAGGWTYTDTSSIHPHRQPPGLWVKGHTRARRWRHKETQE